MTRIYAHKKPNDRMLSWARGRRDEIKEAIQQLQLEDGLMVQIIGKFEKDVCSVCQGEGSVMRPIPGCECDGPRMHRCDACKGTGEPQHVPTSASQEKP